MTPRTSVRALAREIYGELSEEAASASAKDTSLANGPPQGERECAVQGGGDTDLMAQVRALYEESAVPVREIAARAGVTERTIYKYAQKHEWQPRYCWTDDHPCMTGRGWRAANGFAPAQGAGGRYIRREDAGKPFAKGLKALDPAARAKVEAECAEAARRARKASQETELERLDRERWRAHGRMNRSMDPLIRFWNKHPPGRRDPKIERLYLEAWQYALEDLKCARLARDQFETWMKAEDTAQTAPPARE